MTNKKIFQICFGDGYAGSAKMAILNSKLLKEKGMDIIFFASKGSLTEKRTLEAGIKTISLDTKDKDYLEKIYETFESEKPEVVICNHSLDRRIGMKLKKKFKKSFINIAYRHNVSESFPIIGALLYNYYFDYLIACGDGVGESLYKAGIKRNKVKVIHYGINVPENIQQISGEEIKVKYNLKDKIVLGLSAWFHKERKGFDVLFKAFSRLNDERFMLFIIGIPESNQKEVLEYAAEFGITSSKIIMPGYVDNIYEYYKAMDIFVFPSRAEGFPLAPLEAGAAELPIIASNIPGSNEFVFNEETGLLFRSGDDKELTDKINYFVPKKDLQDKCRKNAFKSVIENFTEEKYGEKIYNFLSSL